VKQNNRGRGSRHQAKKKGVLLSEVRENTWGRKGKGGRTWEKGRGLRRKPVAKGNVGIDQKKRLGRGGVRKRSIQRGLILRGEQPVQPEVAGSKLNNGGGKCKLPEKGVVQGRGYW